MTFSRMWTVFLLCYVQLISANQNQASEALGHFIWSELKNDHTSAPLSLEALIEGMRRADAGQPSPVSKAHLQQCLLQFEEEHYNAQASRNLAQAEQFLDELKVNPDIQILVPRRLYMQVLSAGSDIKQKKDPCFNIKCELLDGRELVNTFRTGMPVTQSPDTAIKGFKEGVYGMKAGEKRRLYIHPEYGYGKFCHIEPNSLLIVEVEYLSK